MSVSVQGQDVVPFPRTIGESYHSVLCVDTQRACCICHWRATEVERLDGKSAQATWKGLNEVYTEDMPPASEMVDNFGYGNVALTVCDTCLADPRFFVDPR
jgi:hypothetical protein